MGIKVGPDPDLRDAALDLVLLGLVVGIEGLQVLPVEQQLLVLCLGFLHGLEELNDLLKLRREFFDGLQGHRA